MSTRNKSHFRGIPGSAGARRAKGVVSSLVVAVCLLGGTLGATPALAAPFLPAGEGPGARSALSVTSRSEPPSRSKTRTPVLRNSNRRVRGAAPGDATWTARVNATNTRDGKVVGKGRLSVRRGAIDHLVMTNEAKALANCGDCRTVALSFQVGLVGGRDPSITAKNTSLAINAHCVNCTTFASANQFLLVTDAPVTLTAAGRRTLARVATHLQEVARSTLPTAQLQVEVDRLQAQVVNVLLNEVRRVRRHGSLRLRTMRRDQHGGRLHVRTIPVG